MVLILNDLQESTSLGSLKHEFAFEAYGVPVKIQASSPDLLKEAEQTARTALVGNVRPIEPSGGEHTFGIREDEQGTLFLYQNGEQVSHGDLRRRFYKFFNSLLRIAVAEHAVGRVFIHAGAVGWKDRAIIIPGDSFTGKTTLVTELVKAGAEYYSDEYAVLDDAGLVHPFPRDLSVRYDEGGSVGEKDVEVTSIGGSIGLKPIPIGMVVLTHYSQGAVWSPEQLSLGYGILEVIPHTIPRISNTEFSLKVLNTALSDAIILKCPRGDAAELALSLLSFFENNTNLAKIT